MKANEQRDFAIKFAEKKDLGDFCVLLQAEKVRFRRGGFETVVVPLEPGLMYKSLPDRCRLFLESHRPRVVEASRQLSKSL